MDEMAKAAIKALDDGDLKFVPSRFDKTYLTGLRISVTGVFPDSYGGDTEFQHIIVMNVEKLS